MRTRVVPGLLALAAVVATGCKRSPVRDAAAKATSDEQNVVKAQTEQTKAFEEFRAEIVAWRNSMAAQQAEPEFKDDLAVARLLTGQLSRQASKEQDKEAAQTLARLTRSLAALAASTPAGRIQQHLERAEMGLTSGNLEAAGGEVLAAAGTAYNPSAPALVPEVLGKLEEASKAIRAGDAGKAEELIGAVRERTMADDTAADLAAAHLTAEEAEASVRRKAWPILIAQATEIANKLELVAKRAAPEAKPEVAGAAKEAKQEEPKASPSPQPEPSKSGPANRPATEQPSGQATPETPGKPPAAGSPR